MSLKDSRQSALAEMVGSLWQHSFPNLLALPLFVFESTDDS